MALADPQSVTYLTVAKSMPRVSSDRSGSVYAKDDREVVMTITQQKTAKGRFRTSVNLVHTKTAADPLLPSTNTLYSATCTIIFDRPAAGYTVAEVKGIYDALTGQLNASSGAVVTKILGSES